MTIATVQFMSQALLLDDNRRFHAFLQARGIPHTYLEHPGGHTWEYWDSHVQVALEQHRNAFERL